jgi:hypothetical protein
MLTSGHSGAMTRLPLFLALSPTFIACGTVDPLLDFTNGDAGSDATIEATTADAFSFADVVVSDVKPPPIALDGGGPCLLPDL